MPAERQKDPRLQAAPATARLAYAHYDPGLSKPARFQRSQNDRTTAGSRDTSASRNVAPRRDRAKIPERLAGHSCPPRRYTQAQGGRFFSRPFQDRGELLAA